MLTIDTLKKFGADTDEGMGRCFGKADFYLKLVRIVPGEANFDKLADAIRADNLDAAFEHAHALKGVLGNLSLTPIYNPVCEMTERLRAREQTDYLPLLTEILEKREQLKQLCDD